MLLVDLMHEFELGVWKALFIHLLRMLEALDKTLILKLDRRYVSNLDRCEHHGSLCRIAFVAFGRSLVSAEVPSDAFLAMCLN
jgi:hypothetical protein